jgi:hypothetical protein
MGKIDELKNLKVIELYNNGMNQKEVGKLMKLTQSGVSFILRKYKIKSHRKFTGESNSNWKGGVMYDKRRKLIYSPNHPRPDFLKKYCYEYKLIMEKHLGRYLTEDEVVHHIDGDETNNKLENLKVVTQSEHIRIHKQQGDMKREYSNKYNFLYNNKKEYQKLYNNMYQEKNKEQLINYRKEKWRKKKCIPTLMEKV